jgi:hypothetical protein
MLLFLKVSFLIVVFFFVYAIEPYFFLMIAVTK